MTELEKAFKEKESKVPAERKAADMKVVAEKSCTKCAKYTAK